MRVLIAGCGYVGTELARRLAGSGHDVWGLRRSPISLPRPAQSITADLTKPSELSKLPTGLTHVCYAASADKSGDAEYESAYVLGLRNLLARPEFQEPAFQQFLFVSSTAVYGQNDGQWVDEQSPATPSGFSGKRLLEAEQSLTTSGLPFAILRCAGIYGPDRDRIIRTARSGKGSYPEGPPKYMNRIHRDDVAGALMHLMQRPAQNKVYLGVDKDPASQKEVYEWLSARLGVAMPEKVSPSAPGTRGRAGSNKRCSSRLLVEAGYEFIYPSFREGYERMI